MDDFIRVFEEALDLAPGSVNAQTEFKEMAQWDSLAQISVIVIVEDLFRKVIGSALLDGSRTIGDLVSGIEAA